MDFIKITKQIEDFSLHLKNNPRTILSAKYGDGKTTFLQKFEEKYGDNVFILRISPVNYSVARNEDVFEYIKYDILTQLSKCNLIDDIDVKSIWSAIKDNIFTIDNFMFVCSLACDFIPGAAPFQKVITSINRKKINGKSVKAVLNELSQRNNTYSKYNDSFKSMRGGLYENDGYTILIKETLKKVAGVRKILIIEDMDRMDPQHLFRVLNILGAHVDIDSSTNKFGFDNIVLVLDYEMTEHIYNHYNGDNSGYQGYMAKFMSSYPFRFSISETARAKVYEYIERKCGLSEDVMSQMQITPDYDFDELLMNKSVRDIAHAIDNIESQVIIEVIEHDGSKFSTDVPIVWLLALIKRLFIDIHKPYVVQAILGLEKNGVAKIIGNFMLVTPIMADSCYERNGEYLTSDIRLNMDNLSTFKFRNVKSSYVLTEKLDKSLLTAIETAFEYVRDLKNV